MKYYAVICVQQWTTDRPALGMKAYNGLLHGALRKVLHLHLKATEYGEEHPLIMGVTDSFLKS